MLAIYRFVKNVKRRKLQYGLICIYKWWIIWFANVKMMNLYQYFDDRNYLLNSLCRLYWKNTIIPWKPTVDLCAPKTRKNQINSDWKKKKIYFWISY